MSANMCHLDENGSPADVNLDLSSMPIDNRTLKPNENEDCSHKQLLLTKNCLNGCIKDQNGLRLEHYAEDKLEIQAAIERLRAIRDSEKPVADLSEQLHSPEAPLNSCLDDLGSAGREFPHIENQSQRARLCTLEQTLGEEGSSNNESSSVCTLLGALSLAGEGEAHDEIKYVAYENELQMPHVMRLIQKDLSEPYSIYTYRYFIHNWPKLCFLAMHKDQYIGAIVCKLDVHKVVSKRGYIAMLAIDEHYRKRKIGSNLVLKAIRAMAASDADEVVLETEITNKAALRLYENLGFVRDKRLFRYYLNGVDALRLKLWLR